jgi:hypothetical protein
MGVNNEDQLGALDPRMCGRMTRDLREVGRDVVGRVYWV